MRPVMAKLKFDEGECVEGVKAVLRQIVEALVDDRDSIEIVTQKLDGATGFRLRVGRSDVGKLIGKQGRTARSIRTILDAASIKCSHRFTLDILEGNGGLKP